MFTFTCDPKEYKKELNKIAKEAAELDKNDPKAYWGMLLTAWAALAFISLILFGGILLLINRKS